MNVQKSPFKVYFTHNGIMSFAILTMWASKSKGPPRRPDTIYGLNSLQTVEIIIVIKASPEHFMAGLALRCVGLALKHCLLENHRCHCAGNTEMLCLLGDFINPY